MPLYIFSLISIYPLMTGSQPISDRRRLYCVQIPGLNMDRQRFFEPRSVKQLRQLLVWNERQCLQTRPCPQTRLPKLGMDMGGLIFKKNGRNSFPGRPPLPGERFHGQQAVRGPRSLPPGGVLVALMVRGPQKKLEELLLQFLIQLPDSPCHTPVRRREATTRTAFSSSWGPTGTACRS